MGWQQRDYARLNDEELEELYDIRRPRTSGRGLVWTTVAVVTTAVFAFAYHERGGAVGTVDNGPPPVLYGTPVTQGIFAGYVCTELEYIPVSRTWRCDRYLGNQARVPVYPAAPYKGQCAHMEVEGRDWVCLSGVPETGNT